MNRYRVIQFTPDPFSAGRVPIGAIMQGENGTISVVRAAHLPDAECLGGRSKHGLMKLLLQDLNHIDNIDSLPPCLGPHATLDTFRSLPAGIVDAEKWICNHILPIKQKTKSQRETIQSRTTRRATYGYRCFETFKVAKYVKKTFRPQEDGQHFFSIGARILDIISHWVSNLDELMLLEPIIPEDPSHHIEDDSKLVAKKFLEYKQIIGQSSSPKNATLSAYLLPGIDKKQKARAIENLEISAHRIYDLERAQDRTDLIGRIRALGEQPAPRMLPFVQ